MRTDLLELLAGVSARSPVICVWQAFARRPAPRFAQGAERAASADVDVELVLAVDVSYSMDPDEQALQREGYIAALTSPEFLNALAPGRARPHRHHLFRMGRGWPIRRSLCRGA